MSKSGLHWFRVECDENGKVLSHALAEQPQNDGGLVFYVRARDFKGADKLAAKAYARVMQRARRAANVREGKCPYCGRAQDRKPGRRCSQCVEKDVIYQKRRHARQRGEKVEPLSKKAAFAARRAEDLRNVELETLLRVKRAYEKALRSKTFYFSDWLKRELADAGGKQVA